MLSLLTSASVTLRGTERASGHTTCGIFSIVVARCVCVYRLAVRCALGLPWRILRRTSEILLTHIIDIKISPPSSSLCLCVVYYIPLSLSFGYSLRNSRLFSFVRSFFSPIQLAQPAFLLPPRLHVCCILYTHTFSNQ